MLPAQLVGGCIFNYNPLTILSALLSLALLHETIQTQYFVEHFTSVELSGSFPSSTGSFPGVR